MSALTASPSRILRLLERHQRIDNLVRSFPTCPRWASRQVDQLMVEAEAETRYFLEQ